MGVVSIHNYPAPEGKSGQQAADGLAKLLEILGAVKVGNFCIECETYTSVPTLGMTPARVLNVFHDSDHPASCFALLDTGTCLVSSSSLDALMLNMNSFYKMKNASKMESRGPKYQLGDFTCKIGSVTMGPSFRGILIEVEYGPCVVPFYCWDLMKEFMGGFMIPPRDPATYLQGKMNDLFNPIDTIHQYNEHFNTLRRQVASSFTGSTSSSSSNLNQSSTMHQIPLQSK